MTVRMHGENLKLIQVSVFEFCGGNIIPEFFKYVLRDF